MKSKVRIYMAGCGGMLGDAFYQIFSKDYILKCSDINLSDEWLSFLDFRDFSEYKKHLLDYNPNYLVHLGAITDLEYCEKNPEEAFLTNTTSVENASLIANDLDIPIIFISTAGIFDGKKKYYNDILQ